MFVSSPARPAATSSNRRFAPPLGRFLLALLALAAAALLVAPGVVARPRPTPPRGLEPTLKLDAAFAGIVLFGSESVAIRPNVTVTSGDVVANESPGGWNLDISPSSSTAAGFEVAGDRIRIQPGATVGGDARYNKIKLHGTVEGTQTSPLAIPVYADLPEFKPATDDPSATDVVVAPGDAVLLEGGAYGDVHVGARATVTFAGGTYHLRSLFAETRANLLFESASEVRVVGTMVAENRLTIGGDALPEDVTFYVGGTDDATFAVDVGPRSNVAANVYAPNGTLRLGSRATATGAYLALHVRVDPYSTVALASGFVNHPPVAVPDAATVNAGGTVTILTSGATSVLANDSDPDGDALTANPVAGPASAAAFSLLPDGTFSYTHDGGAATSDVFTYEACDPGGLCSTTTTVTITIVQAPGETLSINPAGTGSGRVTSSPTGIDCPGTCSGDFAFGTVVDLTAVADGGSTFVGWDGALDCGDGQVTIDQDLICIPIFDRGPVGGTDYTLTVTRSGTGGGSVTSDPEGISCGSDCSEVYPLLTRVTLIPRADAGSIFAGWSGSGDCSDGVVDGAGDVTCVAVFNVVTPPPSAVTLTVTLAGGGIGTVSSFPSGILCPGDCSEAYTSGTVVRLNVRPDPGSTFAGFSGDADCADGEVTLTVDTTCTATFQ